MRRRGASHAAKRLRTEAPAMPSKTFPAARRKLNELLKGYAFVKVIEVTHVPAQPGRPAFYHGVAVTQRNSRFASSEPAEHVFFDKGGRLRFNSTFDVGPCKLIDAALGRDHASAHPQVGDILVGMLTDNPRAMGADGSLSGGAGGRRGGVPRLPKVIRSWSRHGNIIMELSRMVEHGTGIAEAETRALLRQAESAMGHAASLAAGLSGGAAAPAIARSAATAMAAADDFWMLARLVLWGSVRPLAVLHSAQSGTPCKAAATETEMFAARELRLSTTAAEYITGLAVRLEDPSLLTAFTDELDMPAAAPPPALAFQYTHHEVGGHIVAAAVVPAHAIPAGAYPVAASPSVYGAAYPVAAAASSYARADSAYAPAAHYVPASPAYMPTSPPRFAGAYVAPAAAETTAVHHPSSPPYAPTSSPMYCPSSPPADGTAADAAAAAAASAQESSSPPYAPSTDALHREEASGCRPPAAGVPASPPYAPTDVAASAHVASAVGGAGSGPHAPQSPPYAPHSPPYAPHSPPYAPARPSTLTAAFSGIGAAPPQPASAHVMGEPPNASSGSAYNNPYAEYDPASPYLVAPAHPPGVSAAANVYAHPRPFEPFQGAL